MQANHSIIGEVTIVTRDKTTGEVVDSFGPHRNKVTDAGVAGLWTRASTVDAGNAYRLDTIHLGSDFGDPASWSIFNPEPAQRTFTSTDQAVVWTIPSADMSFEFPTDPAMRARVLIDGQTLMDDNFPSEVNLTYSSMTLRFANGTVLSYKRFPIRSISREVDVEIVWTITLENSEDYCASQP